MKRPKNLIFFLFWFWNIKQMRQYLFGVKKGQKEKDWNTHDSIGTRSISLNDGTSLSRTY